MVEVALSDRSLLVTDSSELDGHPAVLLSLYPPQPMQGRIVRGVKQDVSIVLMSVQEALELVEAIITEVSVTEEGRNSYLTHFRNPLEGGDKDG